jgi:hypothetical protein
MKRKKSPLANYNEAEIRSAMIHKDIRIPDIVLEVWKKYDKMISSSYVSFIIKGSKSSAGFYVEKVICDLLEKELEKQKSLRVS